jgi:signal transduction histidine kinase
MDSSSSKLARDREEPQSSTARFISRALNQSASQATLLSFLVVYTGIVIVWLLLGLGPALAHRSPTVESVLIRWARGGDFLAALARRMVRASSGTYAARGPVVLYSLFSALNLGLGVFLVKRRPHDRVAQLLAIGMVGTAAAFNLPSHGFIDMFRGRIVDDLHIGFHVVSGVAYMYAVALFPEGRLSPPWLRWVLTPLALATALVGPRLLSRGSLVTNFVVFFGLLIPLLGVISQTYRLNRARDPEEAQQARILRLAVGPAFITGFLFAVVSGVRAWGSTSFSSSLLGGLERAFPPLFAVIPVVLFIGILRYRFWGIDVLANKAVLYGVLAAFFAAIYVLIVVVIGHAIGSGDRLIPGVSILATAVIAVAFEPVRQRMKRFANRLVYGHRATPYEVLTEFSRRMAESLSIEDVLPRMAEAAARGVGAARSRVRVFLPDGGTRWVIWPPGTKEEDYGRTLTIYHDEEPIGDIWVAKGQGEALTDAEERLLADLASDAGLSLRNVRLTAELRARLDEISKQAKEIRESRQRIVAAQDAASRRIERNIHDGAQQDLIALMVKLRLAETLAKKEPSKIVPLLRDLQKETQQALEALRDLARGIYPSLLVDQGLSAALQAHAAKGSLPVDIQAYGVARYSQEVEAAVYFCCTEALQNAAKYARASRGHIRISEDAEMLAFVVSDDGQGFEPEATSRGTGLQGMADRLAALGGNLEVESRPGYGTTVRGWIPTRAVELL